MFKKILKANPYHDTQGRFSTKDSAHSVSIGGVFDKQKTRIKEKEDVKTLAAQHKNSKPRNYKDVDYHNDRGQEFCSLQKSKNERLSGDEVKALKFYTTNEGYEAINSTLRGKDKDLIFVEEKTVKKSIKDIDSAFEGSEMGMNAKVYRHIRGASRTSRRLTEMFENGTLEGTIHEDKGYTSTSTVTTTVDKNANYYGGVRISLNVSKKSKAIYVNSRAGVKSNFDSESEVLLPRNGRMKITKARKNGKYIEIDADWLS